MQEGGFIRRTRPRRAKSRVNYSETAKPVKKEQAKEDPFSDGPEIVDIDSDDDSDYHEEFVIKVDSDSQESAPEPGIKSDADEHADGLLKEEDADDDEPLAKKPTKRKKKTSTSEGAEDDKPKKKRKAPKVSPYERTTNRLYEHHPELKDVFSELMNMPPYKAERAEQPNGMTIKLLPFQLEGLRWLLAQEASRFNGGVLADEMGMGKTIQTIALLMHDLTKKPTLVVAPTVAIMQWKNEIDQHTKDKLKICIYHGGNRNYKSKDLEQFDVVLTTYAVIESVYRKQIHGFRRKNGTVKEKSQLHGVKFYRAILDEAHNVKDRQSNTSKAVNALNTEKRWCLTGTPLQNRIGEMYSLIRFLNIEPFPKYYCTVCDCSSKEWKFSDFRHCDKCSHMGMQHTNFFNHFMLKNILRHGVEGPGLESFNNIQTLLKSIMLRRTKVERADDLGLPPRIVTVRRDFFNEEEKDLYRSLYTNIKRKYNSYVEEGVVLNNYANIFSLITSMRQLADHPDLVLKRLTANNDSNLGVIICRLCNDEAEEPIESKCHHRFCRLCIKEYVDSYLETNQKLTCPVCHIGLSIDLSQPALEIDEEAMKKQSIVSRVDMSGKWRSSTKIEALVEELYKLRSNKRTIKSIVFSQFTSMLDLIEWRLKRAGFETVKLQGSMSPTQRDETIKYFMNNIHCEVFLVSLKAGGVALNLCEASQVFIMDPWWNPSVEWQSGDRVHRIGQYRPVKITRFCIEDSIESRIIELQEKKANMIHATINQDEAAINRLTPADLQFLFNN